MNTHGHRHRSAHLGDKVLFNDENLLRLRKAIYDLCWLLNRGYARHSAIKLVGDHYQLPKRQRLAISRAACSDESRKMRAAKCLSIEAIKDRQLVIDGLNLIITIETIMAGGVVLRCRDSCIRDIASIHGTYRQVHETGNAIELLGQTLEFFEPENILWIFDRPVSNSGRLAVMVREIAEAQGWNWQTALMDNPDQFISRSDQIAITSDSAILDEVGQWINLGDHIVANFFPEAWIIDFSNTNYPA
ncbi:DUF434 domain-containing protein [Methylobacter sp. YRD-M1]|uniref:DUF434 domain-containing protein n=1 Tax=Methylobacter sp. YRD-M1 TaxID=2911520 RepID=UPI00227C1CAF|nr:DUF434 domain-containing protein [Methylobacter sp. YRD-M1]WAK04120.1 DUF434 domain-containing protein [Methylobacter sp. YRD-M1]